MDIVGETSFDFRFFTNSWPCDNPSVNQYEQFNYVRKFVLDHEELGSCPEPLLELGGYCWYPDETGNIPLMTFGSDGSIHPIGVGDDVPTDSFYAQDGSSFELPIVHNPDIELQGTATIQKDPSGSGVQAIETYNSTVDKEDGGQSTGVVLTVTKTWDSSGNLTTKITGINYGDSSTPATGDRIAPNTWVNNEGKPVHSDPLPTTSGGAAPVSSATSSDINEVTTSVQQVSSSITNLSTDLSGVITAVNNVKAGQCGGSGQPACEVNLGTFTSPGVHSGSGVVDTSAFGTAGVIAEQGQVRVEIDGLKSELNTAIDGLINPNFVGESLLPSWSADVIGTTVTIDLNKYSDILGLIANFVLFMASINVVFIILD